MNNIGKKQVVIFFVSALAAIFAYFSLMVFYANCTNTIIFTNADPYLREVYLVKDIINNQPTHKQKVIVVGGSSTLFGFNGGMVELNTNFRFINYGTHANLPLNYHIDRIISQSRIGDIIVMPLEFTYYTSTSPIENYFYIQNMIAWGNTYRYIDGKHKILAYIKNNPSKVLFRILKAAIKRENSPNQDQLEKITTQKNTLPIVTYANDIAFISCQGQKWEEYNYQYLSPNGDFCSAEGKRYFNEMNDFLAPNLKLSNFFISEYKRLESFAKAHNIKLFLIYPPTMENPLFSLDDKNTFAKIENLKQELAKHDIKIYGDFRDFHFDRKYFFDTAYHLNAEGANLRTYYFLKQLPKMLEQQ